MKPTMRKTLLGDHRGNLYGIAVLSKFRRNVGSERLMRIVDYAIESS
ncbi:MAG: hypothetical protein ACUVUE_08455 [Candidatus Bathycorpusculaceae bacterium]